MNPEPKLISTEKELCRMCYTCIRDCPAKAIRVLEGQAEVMEDRCIGCGNCVMVCSQKAKRVVSSTGELMELLSSGRKVAALVAPSFPAEFSDTTPGQLVRSLRAMGFSIVAEVAFGADLVAAEYRRLFGHSSGERHIASTCPAVVTFIEKHHPQLVRYLAPIVSPMIASARAMRKLHGEDLATVFIGPCIAKKTEARNAGIPDLVITFGELRTLLEDVPEVALAGENGQFDLPEPGLGSLFPVSRGMLQSANLHEDILSGRIISVDGKNSLVDVIKEFSDGTLDARLLEILCCHGCIMGPGMSVNSSLFSRRTAIRFYANRHVSEMNRKEEFLIRRQLLGLNLKIAFSQRGISRHRPSDSQLSEILKRLGKSRPEDELNCGACGYATCREHAIAIYEGLAEREMCLPYTIERLHSSLVSLRESNQELKNTKEALLNSEKLASMGQLSAGIAHEVNNPLGVILLYANLLLEESEPGSGLHDELRVITEQAERCKKIVSGLLNFARRNKVIPQSVHMDEFIAKCMRAVVIPDNVEVKIENTLGSTILEVDPDQMTQVITNLVVNSVEAMPRGGLLVINT
ncbi:MAG: 4Fe-4S binding protein, partial [Planctomycetes bacterium]|nr:4Fe-4S binding protein [Planctomycetota bacterium]